MRQRIAVIGAGPMGLAVAYQLALDGHQPILFEADDRIGGMTATFDFDGLTLERYYHFHCTSDDAFLQVLDELGLSNKMHWVVTKMGYWYQNKIQTWGNPVALLKFQGLGLIAKFRYGLHIFLSTRRKNWKSLDKLEASSWIKRQVGLEAYEVLWRSLFDKKFYNYANSLSAAWIWSRIRRVGLSRYDLFREKLGFLEGGSKTLSNALKEAIESHGGEIHLKSPVTKVVLDSGNVKGIMISGRFIAFDKVICTIPLPYISSIIPELPPDILKAYQFINNIAVVCVIAKLKRSVTEYFWLNTTDPEIDIPGVIEYSNIRHLEQHVVYAPFYLPVEHPMYNESDQVFKDKLRHYLKIINPVLSDNDFIGFHVSRYRYAQPICVPGFLNILVPISLPINGLWVADVSHYYPEDRSISESIGLGRKIAKMAGNQMEAAN